MQFALLLIAAAQLVLGAPTTGKIDQATLLKNGQTAVSLNAQWKNIAATDACDGPQMACVKNSIATCTNKKWDVSTGRCAEGHQCFALPDTRKEGIAITCTSEKNALSLIESTGATGGDASLPGQAPTTLTDTTASTTAITTTKVRATVTPNADGAVAVVTVTLTVAPGTTTLPANTRTISPSDASKILASIMATQAPVVTPSPTEAASQTRTLSPEDASKALSGILAAGKPTEAPTTTMCKMGTDAAAQPAATGGQSADY
ncbi:hypothetical protein D9619_010853 [Psilocybe cf. subviscida]|uniref:Uncharacterized protein n=1 Tax=Psilocybe cf. subviscida TaxID=2480587 RepID=A0A8H5BAD2_9AGAR|nr:hypothetical protein D9619_010853 [Psilocybe cf. subviscida]